MNLFESGAIVFFALALLAESSWFQGNDAASDFFPCKSQSGGRCFPDNAHYLYHYYHDFQPIHSTQTQPHRAQCLTGPVYLDVVTAADLKTQSPMNKSSHLFSQVHSAHLYFSHFGALLSVPLSGRPSA